MGFAETKRAARLAMFLAMGVRDRTAEERAVYLKSLGVE